MLNADDAGIVSRSSEGLERMITTVIVTAFSAFGLTVSSRPDGDHEPADYRWRECVPFAINSAGQEYKQTIDFNFVYWGGAITANRDLSVEKTRRL